MAGKEMPPEYMWHLDEELVEWFDEVAAQREEKFGGGADETVPMMENEIVNDRLKAQKNTRKRR
jgi:hypothetical protein